MVAPSGPEKSWCNGGAVYFTYMACFSFHHIQWGPFKPRSVGSRDQNSGLYEPRLNFTLVLPVHPYYRPCCIHDISTFLWSTCQDFIENIYSLNWHRFQANSHQELQIIYIFFVFFFQFFWTMIALFFLSSKIFSKWALRSSRFQCEIAIWRQVHRVTEA